jgi:hypothetical protein
LQITPDALLRGLSAQASFLGCAHSVKDFLLKSVPEHPQHQLRSCGYFPTIRLNDGQPLALVV